jgi:hypothetical protein
MTFQVGQNTNSCSDCGAGSSGSPPHGGAAIPAAIRRPPTLGHGLDLHEVNFTNDVWFTSGIKILGNGELDVGVAKITPTDTTTGLTIDITGQYVANVVPTGGAGTVVKRVGEQMFDSFGGIYQVTSVNGSSFPTGYSIVRAGHSPGSPSCSTNCLIQGAGPPERIDYTWAAPTRLNLNPTGLDVALPYALFGAGGLVQFTHNAQCSGCDFVATNGHVLFVYDSAGHTSKIGGIGGAGTDSFGYVGTDSSSAGHSVWSYQNNTAYSSSWPTPFVVQTTTQFVAPVSATATGVTVSSCGTSPAVNSGSSDNAGYVNVGTGTVTACTINFPYTHPKGVYCVANVIVGGVPIAISQSNLLSTTLATFTSASNMAAGNLTWVCM